MNFRKFFFFFFLALAVNLGVAAAQETPLYMDADYYYANGIQLAQGKGFSEPFLWNYLDDAAKLPHPSHAYWMPLASILSAIGMRLARDFDFASAQRGFLLLSALIPPMTASLAYRITARKDLTFFSALLALFSGYYAPVLSTTDTFSLYIFLGGSFFLVLTLRESWFKAVLLGFIAALMHLSRADGFLWLGFAALALFRSSWLKRKSKKPFFLYLLLLLGAYLLLVLPWFLRNFAVFGSVFAPGGEQMLWLTSYNQIFAYPAGNLSLQTWLASGWNAILRARLWALKLNAGTLLGVQGEVILLPFVIFGAWKKRYHQVVCVGVLAWLVTFFMMTFFFPFAGARGGFFHSGAALQMLWWSLAPLGLDYLLGWMVRHRGWKPESRRVFQIGVVVMSFLFTAAILWGRVFSPSARNQAQNAGVSRYRSVEETIEAVDLGQNSAVIVANPPAYFLASERFALALPDGDLQNVRDIAARYGAHYLILEDGAVTDGLLPLFDAPFEQDGVFLLDETEGVKIFVIETD